MPYSDPEKQRAYQAQWYLKNKAQHDKRSRLSATAAKRRNLRFIRRVKQKGCIIYGYNRCPEAIDFHHLKDKDISISKAANQMRWSIKRLKDEIRKCVRVCANCHREIHAGLIEI